MSSKSKHKGDRFERAMKEFFVDLWPDIERRRQCADHQRNEPDLRSDEAELAFEAKHRKNMNVQAWLRQSLIRTPPGYKTGVIFRFSDFFPGRPLDVVVMPACDFKKLIEEEREKKWSSPS